MITAKAFNKWLKQTWWVTDKNAYIPTKDINEATATS